MLHPAHAAMHAGSILLCRRDNTKTIWGRIFILGTLEISNIRILSPNSVFWPKCTFSIKPPLIFDTKQRPNWSKYHCPSLSSAAATIWEHFLNIFSHIFVKFCQLCRKQRPNWSLMTLSPYCLSSAATAVFVAANNFVDACFGRCTLKLTQERSSEYTYKYRNACMFTCMEKRLNYFHADNRTPANDWNVSTHSARAAPQANLKLVYMESYAHKKSKAPCARDSANCIKKCCLLCGDRGNEFRAGSGDVTF